MTLSYRVNKDGELEPSIGAAFELFGVLRTADTRSTGNAVLLARNVGSSMSIRADIWRVGRVNSLMKRGHLQTTEKKIFSIITCASRFHPLSSVLMTGDTRSPGRSRVFSVPT